MKECRWLTLGPVADGEPDAVEVGFRNAVVVAEGQPPEAAAECSECDQSAAQESSAGQPYNGHVPDDTGPVATGKGISWQTGRFRGERRFRGKAPGTGFVTFRLFATKRGGVRRNYCCGGTITRAEE
jgi:hypothetical protein